MGERGDRRVGRSAVRGRDGGAERGSVERLRRVKREVRGRAKRGGKGKDDYSERG